MTEAEWCATVVQIARLHGWRVSHQRPARTEQGWRTAIQGDRGAPDLLLARDGVVLLVELKSDRGRLGPGQAEWLAAAAAHAVVWRPRDLAKVLHALKRPSERDRRPQGSLSALHPPDPPNVAGRTTQAARRTDRDDEPHRIGPDDCTACAAWI